MAVNQVQIRRDSYTNVYAATPNDGEIAYDQTNKRLTVGDGSKLGGHPIPSWQDIQGQTFTSGTTTGSADAQVLTPGVQYQPTAYASGQRFQFIAGYTNTTSATLTVTGLTAKTIKKITGGALANLTAGDITAGLPYDVMYDGTYFVLMGGSVGGVGPAELEDAAAGDYISAIAHADNSDLTPGTSYVKYAEIIAPRSGTYRVRVRITNGDTGTVYAKAYLNGATAGTEATGTFENSPQFQNDDIAVSAGDLIQLYLKGSTGQANIVAAGAFYAIPAIAIMEASPINGGGLYTTYGFWN